LCLFNRLAPLAVKIPEIWWVERNPVPLVLLDLVVVLSNSAVCTACTWMGASAKVGPQFLVVGA
jgi:hypothetical protein